MPKQYDHIHRLLRHKYPKSKTTIYFCTKNCSFKISPALALGKECECSRCGQVFILDKYALTLKEPHCDKCHVRKDRVIVTDNEVITETGPDANTVERAESLTDSLRDRMTPKGITYVQMEDPESDIL